MSIIHKAIQRVPKAIGLAAAIAFCAGGCSTVTALSPQQPSSVQSASVPSDTLQERQQKTATAHRWLEQMRYEERLAEQDYVNAEAASQSAQKTAETLKHKAKNAKAAYAAAQARTAEAKRGYDQAMHAVDELFRPASAQ